MNNDSQVIVSKKERLHWLDYSKTIGMYLVVLGHVKDNTLLLKGIIYSFHMPLFFFLSGFLHKLRIGGGKFCVSLVKQLVIPFFIFNGLTLLTKIKDIQTNGLIVTVYDFLKDFFRKHILRGLSCWSDLVYLKPDMDENHYVLTLENQRRFLVFTYYRNNMDYSTDIVLHIGLSANT